MKRKRKPFTKHLVGGVEVQEPGFTMRWSGGDPDPSTMTPARSRTFAWNAERIGLHLWCDHPLPVGRSVRGWFSAGRVSTIALHGHYVYSASRWTGEELTSAEELQAFGERLQRGCNSLGIGLKGSPGSAAVELWTKLALGQRGKVDHALNEFAEGAIFGGRAEAWDRGEFGECSQWDRSSAYISHLQDPLPIAGTERWSDGLDLDREGITEATVECAPGETPVPVLPAHVWVSRGERRTVYGWGRFAGRWPNCELRAAGERGYKITPRGGVVYDRVGVSPDLLCFAQRVWEARRSFPEAKRIGVALVGKLHEPRVSREVVPFGPFKDWAEAGAAAAELGAGAVIVDRAHVALPVRVRQGFAWYCNMALAAHVLAHARLELLRVLEANLGRVLTVATDGAILYGKGRPKGARIGDGLGEWRLDYQADEATIRGPLAYRLERAGKAPKIRTAGINRALAQKFLSGETVYWKTRGGLLAKHHVGLEVDRSASPQDADEALSRDNSGFSEPPLIRVVELRDGSLANKLA